jgi:hypothetical protein
MGDVLLEQVLEMALQLSPDDRDRLIEALKLKSASATSENERDRDQAWFWTKEWQEGERRVDEHLRRGEYEDFDSMDDFIAALDD